MTAPKEAQYRLLPVKTSEDWQAYHTIRRVVLFEARGRQGVYNPKHPDEHLARNHPLLLWYEGRPIATTRVDLHPAVYAIVRLVAVAQTEQSMGHGRMLLKLIERFAKTQGVHVLVTNAAQDAVVFYEKAGFHHGIWDRNEGGPTTVQLSKILD